MDSILTLPIIHNWITWASVTRGDVVDVSENWRLLWSKIVESYSGTSIGKTADQLEIEGIDFILDDFSQPLPTRVSLMDSRKIFYRFLCIANGLSCEGEQLVDLLYTILGPDVVVPLKFTDGDNRLFHCGFNAFTYDEESGLVIADNRKVAFRSISDGTFMGLRSDANDTFAWPVTMPTLANFGALTIRWIFSAPKDGVIRVGPINGDVTTTNGAFNLQIAANNKLRFIINDGTNVELIDSNSEISLNAITEVWAVIDGTDIRMYVNGVLQADTDILANPPAFYTAEGFGIGFATVEFKGVNYEVAVHGDVLTP